MEINNEFIPPDWDQNQQETKGLQCPMSLLRLNDSTPQARNRAGIIPGTL